MKKMFDGYEAQYSTAEEAMVAVILLPLLVMLGAHLTEFLMPEGWFLYILLSFPRVYLLLYVAARVVLPLHENMKVIVEFIGEIFKEIGDAFEEDSRKKQ